MVVLAVACRPATPAAEARRVAPQDSATGAAPGRPPTVAEIVDRARRSVVVIQTNAGLGTGFVVDKNVIASNLHVFADARAAAVRFADGRFATTDMLAAMDPEHDLALLSFPDTAKPFESLPLGDDTRLRAGNSVVAVGTPQGLELTASTGIVGAIREVNPNLTLLQITAPISPGSSGGPLFDENGEVVGVTTLIVAHGQNLNFAVPSRYIRALLAQPRKPVRLATLSPETPKAKQDSLAEHTTSKPFPTTVAGFEMGSSLKAVKATCPGSIRERKGVLECSAAAVPIPFAKGPVALYFGHNRVVSVHLVATSLEDAKRALNDKYGSPRSGSEAVERARRPRVYLLWTFAQGGNIAVQQDAKGPVTVTYTAPLWDEESNY